MLRSTMTSLTKSRRRKRRKKSSKMINQKMIQTHSEKQRRNPP
jgi:hypothetical protein